MSIINETFNLKKVHWEKVSVCFTSTFLFSQSSTEVAFLHFAKRDKKQAAVKQSKEVRTRTGRASQFKINRAFRKANVWKLRILWKLNFSLYSITYSIHKQWGNNRTQTQHSTTQWDKTKILLLICFCLFVWKGRRPTFLSLFGSRKLEENTTWNTISSSNSSSSS